MKEAGSLPDSYFDDVYAANSDPWNFDGSEYEAGKYRATMATLSPRRFRSALEIGCSIGVFTAMLSSICDRLLAVDVSEVALAQARRRCEALRSVRIQRMRVPEQFPDERFDLVTTCEVAYYWSRADLERAAWRIERALEVGGRWLLVHWTPPVADYPLSGDDVHDIVRGWSAVAAPFRHLTGWRWPQYRLDLYEKTDEVRAA